MRNDALIFTPAEVAERFRVDVHAVLHWIAVGELDAFNVSRGTERRRWRISADAVARFESRRASKSVAPVARQARRRRDRAVEFV